MLNEPIVLDQPGKAAHPVLKNRRIGETATIALVKYDQRDVLKRNEVTNELAPVLKPNGKAKQELVLTGVVISSTMVAGIGGEEAVPAPGDVVRKILRGKSFGEWIEAGNALKPRQVGDIITFTSTEGVVYDASGKPSATLTTQAELDAVPRGRSLGVYGPLEVRRPTPAEAEWVNKAVETYHQLNAAPAVVLDAGQATGTAYADDEDPF